MAVKTVLNIEDTALKHIAIVRALNKSGVATVEWAKTGEEGIEMMETSIRGGNPYDLIITDMHFPFRGQDDWQAGTNVIMELRKRGIEVPVVVCSSCPYKEPLAVDNIFYKQGENTRHFSGEMNRRLENIHMRC